MHFASTLLGLAALASEAAAGHMGFNYGNRFLNNQAKLQADFEYEFRRAQQLPGTSGWNSARLYTMVQQWSTNDVISAIPAAISTQTTLLLGLWISGATAENREAAITNELAALKKAIDQYGTAFTNLVVGISVGSEDLYRYPLAATGGDPGADAAHVVSCIQRTRAALQGTALANTAIGHVDTYDAFLRAENKAVVDAVQWLGFDGYPYWEQENANDISVSRELFYQGLNKTIALAAGKEVWVTETGWPVVGETVGSAVANAANARIYWKEVACSLVGAGINVWWYMLQESQWGQAATDFGVFGAGDLFAIEPYFDLSC